MVLAAIVRRDTPVPRCLNCAHVIVADKYVFLASTFWRGC
jgi:hypothetical protein